MTWHMRAASLALAATLAVFGAACGDGDGRNSEPPEATPPVEQPTTTIPDDTDLSSDSFVGLTEEEAGARAERQGRAWRVVHRDGEDLPVTADYQAFRLNFTVVEGIVTAAATDAEGVAG